MAQKIASLYAEIGGDASGFKRAAADAKKDLASWSAQASQEAKAWQSYEKQKQAASNKTAAEAKRAAADIERANKKSAADFKNTATAALAVAAGVVIAGKKIYDFAKSGAQLEFTKQKFDNLSKSIGTTSDKLLNELREATRGTYSDMQLIESATDFVGLGLANTSDEAIRLSKVSAGLNMNMNQLVLTLTNMTTMRFDQLGVRVDGFKERVDELKKSGLSADAAFKEAFLQQAEAQLALVGNAADSTAGSFMKLESNIANAGDAAKSNAAEALKPIIDVANAYLEQEIAVERNIDTYKRFTGSNEDLTHGLAKTLNTSSDLNEGFVAFEAQMRQGAATTDYYAARFPELMHAINGTSEAMDDYVENSVEMAKANADIIRDAISIQKSNDNFAESQDKISVTLEEEKEKLAKLEQGYYAYAGANANVAIELTNVTNRINEFIPGVTGSQQELHKLMQTQGLLNDMLAGEEPILVKNTGEIEKQAEVVKELQDAHAAAAEEFAKAQSEKLAMLALEKIAMLDGVAGFSDAEFEKAQALLDTAGVAEDSAMREALAFEYAASRIASAIDPAKELEDVLREMALGYKVDVAVNYTSSGNPPQTQAYAPAEFTDPVGNTTPGTNNNQQFGNAKAGGGYLSSGWNMVGDLPGRRFVSGVTELIHGNKVYSSKQSEGLIKSGRVKITSSHALPDDIDIGPPVITGGGGGSVTGTSTTSGVKNEGFDFDSGSSGVGAAVDAIETQVVEMGDTTASAVAMMQVQIQMMAQQVTNMVGQSNVILERIEGVLLGPNPTATGKQVEVALRKAEV